MIGIADGSLIFCVNYLARQASVLLRNLFKFRVTLSMFVNSLQGTPPLVIPCWLLMHACTFGLFQPYLGYFDYVLIISVTCQCV